MGKSRKRVKKVKKPSTSCVVRVSEKKGGGRDHASRINFLFQASSLMAKFENPKLGQFYGKVLTTISEKTSVKLDNTMKRSICKKCRGALVYGENTTYRLKKKKSKKGHPQVMIKCKMCQGVKKFIAKPHHQNQNEKSPPAAESELESVKLTSSLAIS